MRKYIFYIFLIFLANLIYADDNYVWSVLDLSPSSSDKSQSFLRMIFGTIEGVFMGTGNEILGPIFKIINTALLTIGSVILFYIVVSSSIGIAYSGELLGQKWGSIWMPIRSALGIALIVPKASGYCMAQILVMQVIVYGIGAANLIWKSAVDYLGAGGSIMSTSGSTQNISDSQVKSGPMSYAKDLLHLSVCKHTIANSINYQIKTNQINDNYESSFNGFESEDFFIDLDKPVPIPTINQSSEYSNFNEACGSIKVGSVSASGVVDSAANIIKSQLFSNFWYAIDDVGYSIANYCQQKLGNCDSVSTCTNEKNCPAVYGPNGVTTLYNKTIARAAVMYQLGMTSSLPSIEKPKGKFNTGKATKDGWLLAGTYYIDMIQSTNNSINTNISFLQLSSNAIRDNSSRIKPEVAIYQREKAFCDDKRETNYCKKYIGYSKDVANIFYNKEVNNISSIVSEISRGGVNVDSSSRNDAIGMMAILTAFVAIMAVALGVGVGGMGGIAVGVVTAAFGAKMLVGFGQLFFQPTISPIISIGLVGWGMMDLAIMAWGAGAVVIFAGGLVSSIGACMNPVPYARLQLITWAAPFFTMLMTFFLVGGAFLAIYLPLIPFIIFTMAAIGWFFAVIEAMAAAPLLGLAVMHPEGHEILGKSETGLMILLNVFLRPSLMIIGFICASIMSFVSVWIFNETFLTGMFANIITVSAIGPGAVVAFPFIMIVYGMMLMMILEKTFPLIYILPDKITRWIGGSAESIGQDAAGGASGALKSSVSSTSEAMGSAAGDSLTKAGDDHVNARKPDDTSGEGNEDMQIGASSSDSGGIDGGDDSSSGSTDNK